MELFFEEKACSKNPVFGAVDGGDEGIRKTVVLGTDSRVATEHNMEAQANTRKEKQHY